MVTKEARRQWRFYITAGDLAATEYMLAHYGFGHRSAVFRLALVSQVRRDENPSKNDARARAIMQRVKGTVGGMVSKAMLMGKEFNKLVGWSCWFTEEEFTRIEAVKEKWELKNLSEAIRFSLRVQSELDGFAPPEGKW